MKINYLFYATAALFMLLSCNPEPKVVPVSEVKVEPATLKLVVGETKQLTAEVLPSNATEKTVSWGSSKADVAIVSGDGIVVGLKPGMTNITATAGEKYGICSVTVEAQAVPVSRITLSESALDITEGETYTLTATVEPDDATDPSVKWSSSDEKIAKVSGGVVTAVAEGSAVITATAGEQKAQCTVTVWPSYGYVDLGLSVNWGTYNLGANVPEEAGDYYAWGEIEPKEEYSWATYKWCGDGSSQNIKKYNTKGAYGKADNLTVLQAEDDAATVQRGSRWRIPTQAEWEELYNNCTCLETTENGIKGLRVTGKNEMSIFIPYTGYYVEKTLNETNKPFYWSSNLNEDPRYATYPYLSYSSWYGKWFLEMHASDRSTGMSIRPVMNHGYVPVESITLNIETKRLTIGRTLQLTATVIPSWATKGNVIWSSSNSSIASVEEGIVTALAEGTANIVAKADDKEAICVVTVEKQKTPDAVDLGLPSGIKWASFNVGGNAPEDVGDYFAWGETEYKDDYSWATYKLCNDGSSQNLKKYNTNSSFGQQDGKTILDAEDDVARVRFGGKWRIPSNTEWTELYDNCSIIETTVNGVPVLRLVGKNENVIEIPKAGYYADKAPKETNMPYYWSSNLNEDPRRANYSYIYYHSWYGQWLLEIRASDRSVGMPVRAVTE